jgi:hypothetical protein
LLKCVIAGNRLTIKRDTAMLFLLLTPWVLISLFTASPMPDVLWARGRNLAAGTVFA